MARRCGPIPAARSGRSAATSCTSSPDVPTYAARSLWTSTPAVSPLDLIGTAAKAGYSTRKLRSAYAGSALKVRRSSDDATQDIGFVSDQLDTATLASFVGANNGFINTWYDQ